MRALILILALIIPPTGVEFKEIASFPGEVTAFTTDRLGNLYVAKQRQLVKYTRAGKQFAIFNRNVFGEIGTIDATDPFKILVFYKDFSRLAVLDNMLGETVEAFDLQQMNLDQVTLVAKSYNNGIWLFDPVQQTLLRMDEQLKSTITTTRVNQFIEHTIDPVEMMEADNKLYLNDPKRGILVFDVFGNYLKTIGLKNKPSVQVVEDQVLYLSGDTLKSFNMKTLEETTALTALEKAVKVRLEQSRVYVESPSALRILEINAKK